jgi:hypothetical protein
MNANLDIKDGVIYWTGIPSDKLTHEQLLQAFLVLARSNMTIASEPVARYAYRHISCGWNQDDKGLHWFEERVP